MAINLLQPESLLKRLASGQIPRIVDVRETEEFEAGHIPGSVHTTWESWSARPCKTAPAALHQPGYWGVLDHPETGGFKERLEKLGLSNDSDIVVYADGFASNGREGRLAWMFTYLGARMVSILDGGMTGYLRAGGEVTKETYQPENGSFDFDLQHKRRITLEQVRLKYKTGKPVPVDTRSRREFIGDSFEYQPRTGHMPGAVSLPYQLLFDERGSFVRKEIFTELLKDFWNEDLISSCEVGVKASTFAALVEAYTGRIIPVFDGSIMEWALCCDEPIIKEEGCT